MDYTVIPAQGLCVCVYVRAYEVGVELYFTHINPDKQSFVMRIRQKAIWVKRKICKLLTGEQVAGCAYWAVIGRDITDGMEGDTSENKWVIECVNFLN